MKFYFHLVCFFLCLITSNAIMPKDNMLISNTLNKLSDSIFYEPSNKDPRLSKLSIIGVVAFAFGLIVMYQGAFMFFGEKRGIRQRLKGTLLILAATGTSCIGLIMCLGNKELLTEYNKINTFIKNTAAGHQLKAWELAYTRTIIPLRIVVERWITDLTSQPIDRQEKWSFSPKFLQ